MKLFLGMFTYGGVYPKTLDCLVAEVCMQTIKMIKDPQHKFYYKSFFGDADLGRCRSNGTEAFLSTDADVFTMIDRDLIWPWDQDIYTELARDALDNNALVGGIVTQKRFGKHSSARILTDVDVYDDDSYGKLIEAEYIGGAMMVIPRGIIEHVKSTAPVTSLGFSGMYMPIIREDNLYLAEDWAFCQRARDLGYKCFVKLFKGMKHTGDFDYSFDNRFEEVKDGD